MNKIQQKRLLNVAKSLRESKAPKKFDMNFYVHGDIWAESAEFCGTPACALGHYAARPDLQKLLKIEIRNDGEENTFAQLVHRDGGHNASYSQRSVIEHFGVDQKEADALFAPNGCGGAKTPKKAAQFIERFVAQKTKE